ncbi:MAG: Anaerobic nitric oxide reductase transcription regulator NorR [Syntrophus sp. SKADARSKE-3]|nr:Anaerobic nitric oxide reductase transcription regulator NorR [Syntrophus sp. SKADARSKE-3]
MKVSSIMTSVEPLRLTDSIRTAIERMLAHDIDVVPVMNRLNKISGIVTRKGLLSVLHSGVPMAAPIDAGFLKDIPPLAPGDEIADLPESRIPSHVMNNDGILMGVVSSESYTSALSAAFHDFREQMTSIVDSAQNGIVAIDKNGIIITVNLMAKQLLGIRDHAVVGCFILDIIPNSRLMEIMVSGKPLTGQKFVFNDVTSLVVDYAPIIRNEEVVGAVSVFQDLSRLEEISNELGVVKGLNRELAAVIHSSYDGIWLTDHKGLVLDINEAYERITGIPAKEVVGRTMQELVHEGYFDQSVTLLVMKQLKSITINQTVKGKKRILVTGNPIFDDQGNLFRVVTNVRDVTELVSLQEQLSIEKEQTLKYRTELTHLRSLQVRDSCLVFRSKPMTQIIELAMKMADVDSTLLITGESGTGKELVAKLVHRQGKGDASPFISINCAAIPEQLLESELFGYEGGAFTGARKEGKPGLFELAHNGTLFLDEVAELPLNLQVKLLRAIQDKQVTRVGSAKSIPVNVRIIAATNRNLAKMLREGTFREDLYYRLMVVPLHVLPLRERREDIPLLVRSFLDEFNSHFGYEKTLLPEVLDKLVSYSWPGNVRELKNVIERMIVMSPGNEIGLSILPESIYVRRHVPRHGARLKDAVEETERYLIEEAYQEHHSWRKVADVLGVDRATIFRKAQKYHLTKQ